MSKRLPVLVDPAEHARVHALMLSALEDPPEDQAQVLRDCLATLIGLDITRIIKQQGNPPVFYMETEQGNITIGRIDRIYCQAKFRQVVGLVTKVVVPSVTSHVWDQLIQAILMACEDIEVGDASHASHQEREETRRWVEEYLLEKPPREEEWEKAVIAELPFVKAGKTHILIRDFQRWLGFRMNQKLDSHEIGKRLRQVGIESKRVHVWLELGRTSRSTWLVPQDFLPRRGQSRQEKQRPLPGHPGADPEE